MQSLNENEGNRLAAEKRQKASVIRHVEATPGRVVIESDGLIETFKYFTLTDPPRLIVDIYNLEPSFDERTFYAINGFNKIRLGTHADKVRLVFDASESQLPVYKVEKRSEGIVVSWDEPESTLIAEAKAVVIDNSKSEQANTERVAVAKLAAEQAEAEKIAAAELATEKAEAETVATQNQQAAEEQGKQEILLSPHFPSFDTTLQPSDLVMLEKLAEQLKSQKLSRVDVVGHSDNLPILERSRHIFADNLALSEARARSVVEYLQNQLGVPSEVINLRGLGDSKPMADNSTEAGRALNRRVEVSLVTGSVNSANQQELAKDTDVLQHKEVTELSPSECDIVATN